MASKSIYIILRLILLLNLPLVIILGQTKMRHLVNDNIGNRDKIVFYSKTKDGISISQLVNYYDDGRRYSIYNYKNGLKHGRYVKWTRTAKKNNKKKVGQIYFLSEKGSYKNGKRSGGLKCFYPDGEIHWKGIYNAGKIIGPVNEYYPNGKLKREILYFDGEKVGAYKAYYNDGQLQIEGEYFRGIRIGTWKFYDPSQEVVEEIIYQDGEPWEGLYTNWGAIKTPTPCKGVPMIFGFIYKNGNQSLIYRDENNKIFICSSDKRLQKIEENI